MQQSADLADETHNLPSSSPSQELPHDQSSSTSQDLSSTLASSANAKAKRKRTSVHDHAILEAAYQRNSKPDKAERAEIVSRVQLAEKEVQIWFQNRRQNDRRRSKPLLPHELLAHFHHFAPTTLAFSQSSDGTGESQLASPKPDQAQYTPPSSQPSHHRAPDYCSRPLNVQDLLDPASSPTLPATQMQTTSTPPASFEAAPEPVHSGVQNTRPQVGQENGNKQETTPGSGKKRAHDEMTGAVEQPTFEVENVEVGVRAKRDPLQRSASVRLAMTMDGAVKVRTSNELTPSPPKKRGGPSGEGFHPAGGLTRSKSAMDPVEIFKEVTRTGLPRQPGFGRSRDARTWEFFCDSNARDALTTQAEAETAGSAISAINLIRTNSYKSRLQTLSPSTTKTNVHPGTHRGKTSKPKLSRARSSMARLQGLANDRPNRPDKADIHQPLRSPSGDSDKENWAPGTRTSDHPLRRTQVTSQRPILQDNADHIFRDARGEGLATLDAGPETTPRREKAKGEDLDCVQSLLSLSQGAWR